MNNSNVGIRCNVVAPGFVETQMVESVIPMLFSEDNPKLIAPMGRPATTEEVAYACLFWRQMKRLIAPVLF